MRTGVTGGAYPDLGANVSSMERFLANRAELAYTILRVVAGVLFALHGVQKLFSWPVERAAPAVGSQLWIGAIIEITCGTLIAVGLFTRLAALLASGTMAVAYIQFHWKLAFTTKFWPAVNKGELAVLYCFLFLYFACKGGGIWSIDAARRR